MAQLVTCAILALAAASKALCGSVKGSPSELDAFEGICIFKNGAVAIYSNVETPDRKCLTAKYGKVDYENLAANFTWHYNGEGGSPETRCYYNQVNATKRDIFYIAPCDNTEQRETAHLLFSDGKSCFVGTFPQNTGGGCLLWTTPETKDSVSKECEQGFNDQCGPEKYEIYNKEACG